MRVFGGLRPNLRAKESEHRLSEIDSRLQVKYNPFHWANYDILDTDYKNYSVVYTCEDFGLQGIFKWEYAWIIMRRPHAKESEEFKNIEAKGKEVLQREVPTYDINRMRATCQGKDIGCTY